MTAQVNSVVAGRGIDLSSELGAIGLRRAKQQNVMAHKIYDAITASAQTPTDFCYHMTMVIPCDATEFRVALYNAQTGGTFTVTSAAVATSDRIGADPTFGTTTGQARFTPQGGTTWTPITWDNGSASVSIAAAPSATRYTRKLSDWIFCPTAGTNTDGTGKRVVMMRFWVRGTTNLPGNFYCVGTYTQTWRATTANNSLHDGYLWQCIRSTVDGVAVPANFQPNTDLSSLPFVTEIEYRARTPGITIAAIGDSIATGAVNGNTGNMGYGYVFQLVKRLRAKYPSIPIDMANCGCPAQTSSTYQQRAQDWLASGASPGVAVVQVFSQNDGNPSAALNTAAMNRAAKTMAVLQALNCPAALPTPMPNTNLAWDATLDGFRKAMRDEIYAMRSAGMTVIDCEVISDGATPARYLASKTTDGAHPNEAGHADVAATAEASVSLLIG